MQFNQQYHVFNTCVHKFDGINKVEQSWDFTVKYNLKVYSSSQSMSSKFLYFDVFQSVDKCYVIQVKSEYMVFM